MNEKTIGDRIKELRNERSIKLKRKYTGKM